MLTVAALYKFTHLDDPQALKPALAERCLGAGVTGTLLLAPEGINGTIAGTRFGIEAVLTHLRNIPGCSDLDWKESWATEAPFQRMKVRVKREIVTMGRPGVDPLGAVGTYVDPADWNALIGSEDVITIDTRNDYEVAIGTFQGAVDPGTRSFSEFPDWWHAQSGAFEGKRVAMFCTGGIRCEKATSWLKSQGVTQVYHLRGGILKYLEHVAPEESRWEGECFVFDRRVSVGHGLKIGKAQLCYGCRRPLLAKDLSDPAYEEGVSCGHCHSEQSEADRERFRERHRQRARLDFESAG
ncbi:MAG: rhodanese-related sulfurtransferase [Pseudomonadota bacterium]